MALTQEETTKLNTAVQKCTRAALVTEQILDEIQNNSGRSEDITTAITRLKNDYIASNETRGFSKPDGTTIEVDAEGTLSTKTATVNTNGIVKPDNTTLQVDANGTMSIKTGDATGTDNGFMSAADKAKLDGIEAGAQVNTVTGVKGNNEGSYRTGNVNITKANINLGNVDNTHDTDKNVATARTLATARSISIDGGATGTATSFDGSQNISINVTALDVDKASAGTLSVDRGGTGQTTVAETKAGKDAEGNTITTTYATKAELQNLRSGLYEVVTELPAVGEAGKMYLLGVTGASGTNTYKEYIYINNAWEETGAPELDLSSYSKKSETIRTMTVDPISGGNRLTFTYANGITDFINILHQNLEAATQLPQPNGTASAGTSTKYAREDHVHPPQTILAGEAEEAVKLATARQLSVSLESDNAVTFDGSANVTNIPVTGTLPVSKGGTGATSIANIQAGKDGSGNTITTTYATKAEMQALSNGLVQIVSELPATGTEGMLYLVPLTGETDRYEVSTWENNKFVKFGQAKLDLTNYSTKPNTVKDIDYADSILTVTKGDGTVESFHISGSGGTSTVVSPVTITGNTNAVAGHTVTLNFSATSALSGATINKFIVDAGTLGMQNVAATNNAATFTLTIPNSASLSDTYTVSVTAVDSWGNEGSASTHTITIIDVTVDTPVVTLDKSSMYSGSTLQGSTSAFSVTGDTDTHEATDYKICSDSAGDTIVASAMDSSDLLSHTFAANTLSTGTYYVFARHKGVNYGYSAWSSSVTVTVSGTYVNQTTASLNKNSMYPDATLTVTTSAFGVTGGTDIHASTDYKVCSDSAGNNVELNVTASSDLTSHTFTANSLSVGTHYVFARHNGTTYGAGIWSSPVSVTVNSPIVAKPSVIAPVDASTVMMSGDLVVQSSAFSVTGGTDTHQATNWKITDSSGTTVLSSLNNITDKTAHTFTSSELSTLTGGTTYKIQIQHVGATYGTSEWSDIITFIASAGITTRSGRLIYRHSSDAGSVIEFDMFGTAMKLFVADASYRGTSIKFGTYSKDSSLKNYSTYYSGTNYFYSGGSTTSGATYQSGATSGTNVASYSELPALTDAQLQERLSPLSDDLTARANCDVWMTYEGSTDSKSISGVPAVKHCRDIANISGITGGLDLPNLYELSMMYIESDYIDELDPTASSNSTKILSKGSNSNRWFNGGYAWSSTEYSATNVCYVHYYGYVNCNSKNDAYCVAPVREL